MGSLTAAEILEQGSELAGVTYDSTDAKPLQWLKQWLKSVALGWPWAETSDIATITLDAGKYIVEFGNGVAPNLQRHVTRVTFPFKIIYGDNYLPRDIIQQPYIESVLTAASVVTGTPDKAAYTRMSEGKMRLVFNRKPTEALNIQVSYQYDPAYALLTTDVPWYINDDTMIHAIAFKTAEYHEGKEAEATRAFAEALSIMLRNDKLKFGNIEDFDLKLSRRFAGK